MAINDPIADMLTRIRNASRNRSKTVVCFNKPSTSLCGLKVSLCSKVSSR